MSESIDDSMVHIKMRSAISFVLAIVVATNFATTVLLSIAGNARDIERMKKELKYEIAIDHLKVELKECKNK